MCERLKFEQQAYDLGKKYIVGLDEAGRGPMAGPLVVGAVIFPQGYYNDKINDSKKLTEKSVKNSIRLLFKKHWPIRLKLLMLQM